MDQTTSRSVGVSPCPHLRLLAAAGVFVVVLAGVADQALPRLEASADPALLTDGPWSSPAFEPLARLPSSPSISVALAIGLAAGLVGCYACSLWLARTIPAGRRALSLILVTAALASGLIVMSPPTRKADLFYYAFQGRMLVRIHANPYVVPPRAEQTDAWFPLLSPVWRDLTTGYGPAWLVLSAGVDAVADRGGTIPDVVRMLLFFRALFAGFTIANTFLIWLILGDLASDRRVVGAIAYAWNPAVLSFGIEHNDTAMLFLALLGIWLYLRRRPTLAVIALTLSALVKYYTAPLLLGVLIWRWRVSDGRASRYRLPIVAMATAALAAAPFDPIAVAPQIPVYLVQSGRLAHLAQSPFELVLGLSAVVGIRFARLTTVQRFSQIIENATLALFVYLVIASRDWFPWYLVTAVGLGSLLGGWWLDAAATVGGSWLLGLHQGTAYLAALFQHRFGVDPVRTEDVILFGPALAVVATRALWRWRRWPERTLLAVGLLTLVGFTTAVELPFVGHWANVPPLVDFGGRQPGPVVFGTALEWDDWSWGVKVDQIETPAGPEGPRSLCVTFASADGAFFAHHPSFSTRGYSALSLDLDSFGAAPASLILAVRGSDGKSLGAAHLNASVSPAGYGDWRHLEVPLSTLGAADTTVTGVLLQRASATGNQKVCLQNLEFSK